jgi:hypothetical protein
VHAALSRAVSSRARRLSSNESRSSRRSWYVEAV